MVLEESLILPRVDQGHKQNVIYMKGPIKLGDYCSVL